ncbi:MAG: hypothetical protein U0836_09380 [Pirellulales bacterium]
MDLGAAAEGIGRLFDGLVVLTFELATAAGLAVVFFRARRRRLTERGQARFEAHSRDALGLPKSRPRPALPCSQITIATWLAAFAWFAAVFAAIRAAILYGAMPGDPEAASFFAVVWGLAVAALMIAFGRRAAANGAATAICMHLAMVGFFAWAYS